MGVNLYENSKKQCAIGVVNIWRKLFTDCDNVILISFILWLESDKIGLESALVDMGFL